MIWHDNVLIQRDEDSMISHGSYIRSCFGKGWHGISSRNDFLWWLTMMFTPQKPLNHWEDQRIEVSSFNSGAWYRGMYFFDCPVCRFYSSVPFAHQPDYAIAQAQCSCPVLGTCWSAYLHLDSWKKYAQIWKANYFSATDSHIGAWSISFISFGFCRFTVDHCKLM